MWDPTDVDRLVAVYGDSADNSTPPSSPLTRAWLAVTDLDGTPVAMLDHSTGSAVSRYSFDPTGGVLEATTSAAPDGVYPPRLEVGWKSLFAERLDDPLHGTKGVPFVERENWHTNPQDIPVGSARPFSPARPR